MDIRFFSVMTGSAGSSFAAQVYVRKHSLGNDCADLFRRCNDVCVGKVTVTRRGPVSAVLQQLPDQGQVLSLTPAETI